MREKITKALKTRATAIKKVLEDYNRQVVLMIPPHLQLTWSEVVNMASIAEFDLLRDTREDTRSWAQPVQRQAMGLYFNIKQAKEEIACLNIEICRLLTHMFNEHVDYTCLIDNLRTSDSALAFKISSQWQYWSAIHKELVVHLHDTSKLQGFSGALTVRQRIDRDPVLSHRISLPAWASVVSEESYSDKIDNDKHIMRGDMNIVNDVVTLVCWTDNLA